MLKPSFLATSLIALVTILFTGCADEPDTPGEKLDQAIEEFDDAAKEIGDGAEDVGEEIGDAVEDIGDEIGDAIDKK